MDNPSTTPTRIVQLTIDTIDDCTTALENIVEENFSPGSSPRSTSLNAMLLNVEAITSRLRTLSFEAHDALSVSGLREVNETGPIVEDVPGNSDDEDSSIRDEVVPIDYDPTVEEDTHDDSCDIFDSDGLPYDSDDSGKYLWRVLDVL